MWCKKDTTVGRMCGVLKGYDEFISLLGDVTIAELGIWVVVAVFLYKVYQKLNEYIIKQHEDEEERERKIKVAYDGVQKYPEYRQQSLNIQHEFTDKFTEISDVLADLSNRLAIMEEHDIRRERNQLREKLVQSYNYYTSIEKNPSQSWTNMEAEAFWELYRDYRAAKGNGFVEDTIKPAMEALTVIKVC